jgi:uncharacterized tellurite resistance protein B-like protein
MFGRFSKTAADDPAGDRLAAAVRRHLPGADDPTARIVTAVAGLLGGVAYADREYRAEEEGVVRSALSRVHGMTPRGIEAILEALREDIVTISTVQAPRYARTLLELADRDLRREVLGFLIDLAAADDRISHDELALLRTTTRALGLEQADYNELQARHRDKIASLK